MTVSEKQQKRRKEIAMAVREIMQKTNFNNITVDDICNATGIAKGTFYHYFSSKDSLLNEITYPIDDFFSNFEDELTKELDFNEAINQYAENYATYVTTSGVEMCNTVILAMINTSNKRFISHDRTAINLLYRIISNGQERGEVTTEFSAKQICDMFVVVLRGYILNWYACGGNYDLVEAITTHLRLFASAFCLDKNGEKTPGVKG
jgi:AcrR family transcriptional regulator